MSDPTNDDLLARILALPPEERARMLAQLGLAPAPPPALSMGSDTQVGEMNTGDIAGRDVRKGAEGSVELSDDARLNGVAVGVNLGTIIYGRSPAEEERRQLVRYLARLAAKLRRLPLSGLAARLDDGEGVAMERVYVELATTGKCEDYVGAAEDRRFFIGGDLPDDLKPYLRGTKLPLHPTAAYDRDLVLPRSAIIEITSERVSGRGHAPDVVGQIRLWRACLATEAIGSSARRILLGDPGGGKSTFLRHLAWALAQRGLDQLDGRTELRGWVDDARLLPVLLPLRRLAGQLAGDGAAPAIVSTTLVGEMEREYGARDAADLLDRALTTGSALLLLDGLDEVPVEATPNSASRLATLRAIRAFVDLYPDAKMVITCRTRALSDELRSCLSWNVETIAPFTLGQIRHFIGAWFATLHARGSLDQEKADYYAQTLIDAIVGGERLRRMAETPLLLTMMALVLVERGKLPRDRPLLYEEVLRQLLGEWDVQKGGQSLAEVLGTPNLRGDDLRPMLDQLSFDAHAGAASEDGRGRLPADDLHLTLTKYLAKIRVPGA